MRPREADSLRENLEIPSVRFEKAEVWTLVSVNNMGQQQIKSQ
jgi:hypothetical protein